MNIECIGKRCFVSDSLDVNLISESSVLNGIASGNIEIKYISYIGESGYIVELDDSDSYDLDDKLQCYSFAVPIANFELKRKYNAKN